MNNNWLVEEIKEFGVRCKESYKTGIINQEEHDYEKEKEMSYIRMCLGEGMITLEEHNELVEIWEK